MVLSEILKEYLPTKWSRWIMGLTIALAGTEITSPMTLPHSMVSTWSKQELQILTILILSTLLIGTFITLLLVIAAYRKIHKEIFTMTRPVLDEETKNKIESAENFINEFGDLVDDAPTLRRLIKDERSRYEIEHQDDWK